MRFLAQDRTARHVVVVVAVKLVVLAALWWVFFRDTRVEPDADGVAAAVLRAPDSSDSHAPEGVP
jgi:hypothetical protein